MEKVPQAGYQIKGLWISGIQRSLKLQNLAFPLKLASSLVRSRQILRAFNPDVAIGTGGYASAPLLRVATQRKVPSLIQEQNSYAGVTNKWLAGRVQKICVAYQNMETFFPANKIKVTGNPVRQDLVAVSEKRKEAIQFFKLDKSKKTLLVLGGSLGAKRINQLIEENKEFFEQLNVQVIWQCGKQYEEIYKTAESKIVQIYPFLNRMDLAYAAADIVISRSGALSVSELCLVGKPVILIPSPNVAEDHQTKNARSISENKAAILLPENELENKFQQQFEMLLKDDSLQKKLSENIKKLAKPNATKDIVDEIEKLLKR